MTTLVSSPGGILHRPAAGTLRLLVSTQRIGRRFRELRAALPSPRAGGSLHDAVTANQHQAVSLAIATEPTGELP